MFFLWVNKGFPSHSFPFLSTPSRKISFLSIPSHSFPWKRIHFTLSQKKISQLFSLLPSLSRKVPFLRIPSCFFLVLPIPYPFFPNEKNRPSWFSVCMLRYLSIIIFMPYPWLCISGASSMCCEPFAFEMPALVFFSLHCYGSENKLLQIWAYYGLLCRFWCPRPC